MVTAMTVNNGLVMGTSITDGLAVMLPRLLAINVMLTFIAAFMGRNILTLAHLQHLNQYLLKFAYNIKEGIVTVQNDTD